ncbi:MAG: VOC family protein [Oscillospiraceae bacterium]|nr:VOC family protein [Oscillospiraceae bacterium]
MMVKGIEHLAIFSNDTAALKNWYMEMFGFEQVYDNGKGTYFLKAQDGGMLEFVTAEEVASAQGAKTSGIRHIAIAVSDFEGMVEKLMTESVGVVSEPAESNGIKTFFFRDIDGNVLHLIFRPNPL